MDTNTAIAYLGEWIWLTEFVEEHDELCAEVFFNHDDAIEMGRHKAYKFWYEDGEPGIVWIRDTGMKNPALFDAWVKYLRANEELLPALEDVQ